MKLLVTWTRDTRVEFTKNSIIRRMRLPFIFLSISTAGFSRFLIIHADIQRADADQQAHVP